MLPVIIWGLKHLTGEMDGLSGLKKIQPGRIKSLPSSKTEDLYSPKSHFLKAVVLNLPNAAAL